MNAKTIGIGLLILIWCGIQLGIGLRGGRVFAHGMRTVGPGEDGFKGYLAFYGLLTAVGGVFTVMGFLGR